MISVVAKLPRTPDMVYSFLKVISKKVIIFNLNLILIDALFLSQSIPVKKPNLMGFEMGSLVFHSPCQMIIWPYWDSAGRIWPLIENKSEYR